MRKNHYPLRGYIPTNRSKHNLKAHLILVCKYRKKLLQGGLNNFIKSVIDEIATQNNFIIIAMESDMGATKKANSSSLKPELSCYQSFLPFL